MATDQERVVPPAAAPAGTPGMGEEAETAHAGGEAAAVQERPRGGGGGAAVCAATAVSASAKATAWSRT